ncbi:LamG-like jellyroll fold domain-containing protein [Planctomycetota bacterium]
MSTKNERVRLVLVGVVAAIVVSGGSAKADFTFGTPKNLELTGHPDFSPCISADSLELYFVTRQESGSDNWDILISTRKTTDGEWSEPNNLGKLVNSDVEDSNPTLSADGLELYFNSFRTDGLGGTDLWVTRRATKSDPWGEPVNLGQPINSEAAESAPSISADGLELYFDFYDPCLPDDDPAQGFYVSRRESQDGPWGEPVTLGPVINSWPVQWEPEISSDGFLLLWADYWDGDPRPGGFGDRDLWFSQRATKDGQWNEPVNLGPVINGPYHDRSPVISADGSTIYFSSNRFSSSHHYIHYDIYEASIIPVVDFDGDGVVSINDLLMLIESLGTDDPKCDIGPMAWGDGVVDEADLEVLLDYWGTDVNAIDPVAYWKLDESEGTIAYDSAGSNNASLVGDPVWQPAGGLLDGAFELDGIDDGAEAGFLFDPGDTAFSAFAWIKGGNLDQVIISQAKGQFGKGVNWLMTDTFTGNLMTEFQCLDENWSPHDDLLSSIQVTDGQWHHVGLVWDSLGTRILYVDGIEVAKDTVRSGMLLLEDGGINIGFQASILHRPGYWSGLIDDARIYNQALSADEIEILAQ